MLLGKPKDKFEVYNDLDDELVNLFRCVGIGPRNSCWSWDCCP